MSSSLPPYARRGGNESAAAKTTPRKLQAATKSRETPTGASWTSTSHTGLEATALRRHSSRVLANSSAERRETACVLGQVSIKKAQSLHLLRETAAQGNLCAAVSCRSLLWLGVAVCELPLIIIVVTTVHNAEPKPPHVMSRRTFPSYPILRLQIFYSPSVLIHSPLDGISFLSAPIPFIYYISYWSPYS